MDTQSWICDSEQTPRFFFEYFYTPTGNVLNAVLVVARIKNTLVIRPLNTRYRKP